MVELQILGHLILFAICLLIPSVVFPNPKNPEEFHEPLQYKVMKFGYDSIPFALFVFVPLEIIYWICHWYFVQ